MKVWMWQRLYKIRGYGQVYSDLGNDTNNLMINMPDENMRECGLIWLCPKPNLVLVDRKHLGGME